MKRTILIINLIVSSLCFSQRVKCEETNYLDYHDREFSSYHYIESDNSMRSLQVFIVNNKAFEKISLKIPEIFRNRPKQDFTDIYVLGISGFDKNTISQTEKEIIENFILDIKKYREFNKLSPIDNDEFTYKNIVRYIQNIDELCLYMICKKNTK